MNKRERFYYQSSQWRMRLHLLRHLFDDDHEPSSAPVDFARIPGGVRITIGHAKCTCGRIWGSTSRVAKPHVLRIAVNRMQIPALTLDAKIVNNVLTLEET